MRKNLFKIKKILLFRQLGEKLFNRLYKRTLLFRIIYNQLNTLQFFKLHYFYNLRAQSNSWHGIIENNIFFQLLS